MDYKYLGSINSPAELKSLNSEQLNTLSAEMRDCIMETVSTNGGHLASNLGAVELTIALHKVFNSPDDSIIFDVGHQCYAHKLITGRFDRFGTLRQKDGISGFMRPDESEHDPIITGHSSNSISAACGIAKANTIAGNKNYAVAVIGDGALTGGMAFEGLNNSVHSGDKLIVVINDNKMSISKNVGGLSKYLNNVRTKPSYYTFKAAVDKFISKIPLIGKPLKKSLSNSKVMFKHVVYHNNIFEGLGFNYLGPIDGHDIDKISKVLEIAKNSKKPCVVHVLTVKGKGYKYAEAMPTDYHGVAPFDVESGLDASGKGSYSDAFGSALCKLAEVDEKICAITAAMTEGTGLLEFSNKFPKRFTDVGIAEQHGVTFACGLAKKGFKPFFAVYSSFLQRGYDQVMHDAAVANLPITICVDRAGLVGNDGETHQGLFDICFLSSIPNVSIFSPSSYDELENLLLRASKRDKGVWVIRYPRGTEVKTEGFKADEGVFNFINNDSKTVVISYGHTFTTCYNTLKEKKIDIIKLNQINDISDKLVGIIKKYDNVYMFEETIERGSMGECIAKKLLENEFKGKFKHISVCNEFVKQATQNEQRNQYSLDKDAIKNIVCGG